jgi:hypothetical protein
MNNKLIVGGIFCDLQKGFELTTKYWVNWNPVELKENSKHLLDLI